MHRIDPFVLRISGEFGLRWYGLAYVAGFFCAYLFIRGLARRGLTQMAPPRVADFVIAAAVGTIIGGRLGYCVFYDRELLIAFSSSFPFWGVLELNKGGMASHGGMIGIIIACLIFARRHGLMATHLFDLTTVGGAIGIFFGRVANFINGELLGRPAPPDLPWAVKFPQEVTAEQLNSEAFEPIVAAVREMALAGELYGKTLYTQFLVAVRKSDELAAIVKPFLTPRHPSQLYEALGEGLLLFAALVLIWREPRKPGVVGAWFVVLYAMVRIAGEQFRMPDAHIADQEFAMWHITRGQLLSGVMLLAGLVILVWWSRRDARRISGWGRAGVRCRIDAEG